MQHRRVRNPSAPAPLNDTQISQLKERRIRELETNYKRHAQQLRKLIDQIKNGKQKG